MEFEEFEIGMTFFTATGAWRVTDKGTRVVVASKLYEGIANENELVFDYWDFGGCRREPFPEEAGHSLWNEGRDGA